MIRDPSDGSVQQTQKSAPGYQGPLPSGESDPVVRPDCPGAEAIPSGLPILDDPKEIERLNRSRDWIKQWNERRGEMRHD